MQPFYGVFLDLRKAFNAMDRESALIKLRPKKKSTVVWPSVGMFGGLLVLAGSLIKYDQKKSTVIWPLVGMLLIWRVPQYNYNLRPERYNYKLLIVRPGKNGTVIWPLVGMFEGFHNPINLTNLSSNTNDSTDGTRGEQGGTEVEEGNHRDGH